MGQGGYLIYKLKIKNDFNSISTDDIIRQSVNNEDPR
jgi:hypothetical protein